MSPVHICTPPSSPPSSPAASWDWDSSPPSPSLVDLTISESSLPPSPPQRIIDPLAASYNAKDSKRNSSCTIQPKKARNTAPLPTTQTSQPNAGKKRSQADDLEYEIWEEASNKVFESGCRTIDLRFLTIYFFMSHDRSLFKFNSTVIAS
jgi:hypothetical protein